MAPSWQPRGPARGRRRRRPERTVDGGCERRANHGNTGESEHTGWLYETRGDESTARIRRREFVGGGLRRRPLAAREEGNDDETTRVRFLRTRASTRPRDCIPSTGLGGATPREAGDERRFAAASGNGGEAARGGGKVLCGACELLGVLRVLPHNLRGGGGAKRENGGELYRDETGRCDEMPTARE